MSAVLQQRMSVDEFLAWSEGQEGRYELEDGAVVAMAPERLLHTEAKGEAFAALRAAIRSANAPCRALTEGATVRIDAHTAFEPDALVYCGARLPGAGLECPDPVIIVEVLSPSTTTRDIGVKLGGYFKLPSLHHYLILDADKRLVIHHRRGEHAIETAVATSGELRLDPPGITLRVEDLFPPAEA